MSTIRAFQTPLNDYSREQYTQYLEDQLERISSFMLFQKKQNQKNNQLIEMIEDQNQKIKLMNDKILLLEIYHHQNFKFNQKVFNSVEKVSILQKKVQKLQFTLPEQKYQIIQSKSSKKNQISKDIREMICSQINNKFEEIQNKINSVERSLIGKISLIVQEKKQHCQKVQTIKNTKNNNFSKNSTPLHTNCTDNGTNKTRQIQSSQSFKKYEADHRQKRVSSFVNQRLDKLQRQLNNLQNQKDMSRSINSLTDRSIKQKKQTSPISSYLKKQKQFQSQQQNFDLNRQLTSKSFYSVMQKQNNPIKKNKKKQKRSKSKSEIKSERSYSQSNLSKQKKVKNNPKNQNQKSQMKSNKIKNVSQKRQSKQDILTKKENKKSQKKQVNSIKINKNTNKILEIKTLVDEKNTKNRKSQLQKDKICNKNNRRKSSTSQLSLSQNSIKSVSRSKSIDKKYKNQKQYLMYCDKFHY